MMRLGLFLNFEHAGEGSAALYAGQIGLAREAEAQGFDEIWVSEHHFNGFSRSASIVALLAHLAAVTSRIRLGSAAVLVPLHDPIRLAEDIATLDVLSGGRLNLGLARGGPFPAQYRHFGLTPEAAQARMGEGTDLLLRLLREEAVSFQGRWHRCEDVTIVPRPLQAPLPVWAASAASGTIVEAAKRGFGLMGGQPWPPAKLQDVVRRYGAQSGGRVPDLVLLRAVCVADSDAEAERIVRPAAEHFVAQMRRETGPDGPPFSVEGFLANAIVGSAQTCRRRVAELRAAVAVASLVIKPVSLDPALAREMLARFRTEVVPSVLSETPAGLSP